MIMTAFDCSLLTLVFLVASMLPHFFPSSSYQLILSLMWFHVLCIMSVSRCFFNVLCRQIFPLTQYFYVVIRWAKSLMLNLGEVNAFNDAFISLLLWLFLLFYYYTFLLLGAMDLLSTLEQIIVNSKRGNGKLGC